MNDLISIEKIAQRQRLKTLDLDSVSSPITKRVYNLALDDFISWFLQAPRPGYAGVSYLCRSRTKSAHASRFGGLQYSARVDRNPVPESWLLN